jgi:hypothetical protein
VYGIGADAVDGDASTCVKTSEGKFGALRIDLDPGTLPKKVVIHTRASSNIACDDQMSGMDGVTVSIGTPGHSGEQFSDTIHHSCGIAKHTLTSEHDVNELYVVIEAAADVSSPFYVCEITGEAFDVDAFQNTTVIDMSGRHSFQDLGGLGADFLSASAVNDNVMNCTNDGGTVSATWLPSEAREWGGG